VLNLLPPQLANRIETLIGLLPEETEIYLVGGALRDMLRGNPIHDLDLVMTGDVLAASRRIADAIGAAYYPLDEVRQTARIILQHPPGSRLVIDVASMRGLSLESDLRGRDFTVNAIALDLRHPQKLIDPLGGAQDLHSNRLRACSPQAFQNDPVRVVRAVRLAFAYHLKIDSQTQILIRQAASSLGRVSVERQRDELFRILESEDTASAVRALDRLGVLNFLLPELVELKGVDQPPPHVYDVWEHTLNTVKRLNDLLDVLRPDYDPEQGGSLALGLAALRLGRYRSQIHSHLAESLTLDRGARSLLTLAALYHDIAKPLTKSVDEHERIRFFEHDQLGAEILARRAAAMRLSTLEVGRLKRVVHHHMRPMFLSQDGAMPTRRAIYRFFRATGEAGVDVCLLSLADFMATYGSALPQESWDRHLEVIHKLLDAWWENPAAVISPPPLVKGRQLMALFGLPSGPLIGTLLDAVHEAQAAGEITTQEQALAFVGTLIQQVSGKDDREEPN
jgi:putative nucleotidyltransferase with HDIG domain